MVNTKKENVMMKYAYNREEIFAILETHVEPASSAPQQ